MEHYLASKISTWCFKSNDSMDDKNRAAITYGIELFLDRILKFIGIMLIAIVIGEIPGMIIAIGCFSLLRFYAGGLHMQTSLGCFLSMLFVGLSAILCAKTGVVLPIYIFIILTALEFLVVSRYAPHFTANNPIYDGKIIKHKNTFAKLVILIYGLLIIFLPQNSVKVLIAVPTLWETISILPYWKKREHADE